MTIAVVWDVKHQTKQASKLKHHKTKQCSFNFFFRIGFQIERIKPECENLEISQPLNISTNTQSSSCHTPADPFSLYLAKFVDIRWNIVSFPNIYSKAYLTLIPPKFFVLKIFSAFYVCYVYIQEHFRLDFFVEVNTMNPDQTAPKSSLIWVHIVWKNISRGESIMG